MNVGTARVTRVGIMVDEDGDASYWADIDDANCPLLARDIQNDVGPDLDLPCEVRTEW